MMLSEGMAVVYESGGGEYGPWGIKTLKQIEAQAKFGSSLVPLRFSLLTSPATLLQVLIYV